MADGLNSETANGLNQAVLSSFLWAGRPEAHFISKPISSNSPSDDRPTVSGKKGDRPTAERPGPGERTPSARRRVPSVAPPSRRPGTSSPRLLFRSPFGFGHQSHPRRPSHHVEGAAGGPHPHNRPRSPRSRGVRGRQCDPATGLALRRLALLPPPPRSSTISSKPYSTGDTLTPRLHSAKAAACATLTRTGCSRKCLWAMMFAQG